MASLEHAHVLSAATGRLRSQHVVRQPSGVRAAAGMDLEHGVRVWLPFSLYMRAYWGQQGILDGSEAAGHSEHWVRGCQDIEASQRSRSPANLLLIVDRSLEGRCDSLIFI